MKASVKNLESTLNNSLSNYISVVVLLLGGLPQVAVQKAPAIASFVEHFKVAIMRGCHWKILTVLWKVSLKITFP